MSSQQFTTLALLCIPAEQRIAGWPTKGCCPSLVVNCCKYSNFSFVCKQCFIPRRLHFQIPHWCAKPYILVKCICHHHIYMNFSRTLRLSATSWCPGVLCQHKHILTLVRSRKSEAELPLTENGKVMLVFIVKNICV